MKKIQIPQELLDGFIHLSRITPEQTQKIADVLEDMEVGFSFNDFEDKVKSEIDLGDIDFGILEIIFSFGSILLDTENDQYENLIEKLVQSFNTQLSDKDIKSKDNLSESLKSHLTVIFQKSKNLVSTFKTFRLISENSNIYKESNVMTDIRMIFEELNKSPQKGLIIHHLRVKYTDDYTEKALDLSLDRDDIQGLIDTLSRALEKEKCLRDNFNNINFIELK